MVRGGWTVHRADPTPWEREWIGWVQLGGGFDLVCFVSGGDRGAIAVLVGEPVCTTHISP